MRDGTGVSHRLVRIDDPILRVPQLAIHLAEDRKSLTLDPQRHINAVWGVGERVESFVGYVAQRAGVAAADVLAADLMTHDLTPSALIGASVNGTASLLSAPRLDNQASCYAGMEALLAVDVDSASSGFVPVLAIFDHEEVGSASGHGAQSDLLSSVLERIVLAALVEEVDNGGHELRQAAILEVQRARTVIDFAARRVNPPVYQLGEWVIPRGYSIIINIAQIHGDPDVFPQPDRFDPQRYIGSKPSPFAWIPFGGGTRRCVGAAFANMEMDVVLRTVLRHFTLETTTAAGERSHGRGVAFTPKDGGRVVMRRR